jgi:hypothetical protein
LASVVGPNLPYDNKLDARGGQPFLISMNNVG